MQLSEPQWQQVLALVQQQVPDTALATELADHLATLVETEMATELPFDVALKHALHTFSLTEIQLTHMQIQQAQQKPMAERLHHLALWLAYVTVCTGAAFKTLSFPLANSLMVWGFALFSLVLWAAVGVPFRWRVGFAPNIRHGFFIPWFVGVGVLGQGVLFLATHAMLGAEIALAGLLLLTLSSLWAVFHWQHMRLGMQAQPRVLKRYILGPLVCLLVVIVLWRSGIGQLAQ